MKKTIFATGVLALMLTGCNTQEMMQVANGLGSMQPAPQTNVEKTEAATEVKKESAEKSAAKAETTAKVDNRHCIPRMGGGNVSWMDMATKLILSPLIESAIKEASGEDIKFPAKLMNTCEADDKLKYVTALTNQYYDNLNMVNTKILEALEENDEIKNLKAEMADQKAKEDRADINDGIEAHTTKMLELLETAKVKDEKKVNEAWGIFTKTTSLYTPTLLGWDKEIAEFGKDNFPWAIQNFGAVKLVVQQIGIIVPILKNGSGAFEKLATSNNITLNKKEAELAAAKIKVPTEEELASEVSEI